tara:strand:- start:50 stop:2488 length:2439 start_codon:yes stop_codon:yes gene_type:complete
MAIRFLNALNIDGTVTATINARGTNTYDGILVSTSGLIERRSKSEIRSDIGAGTMSSFTLAGSSGSSSTISNGDTVTLIAGSGITTVGNGSGGVTITATASGYSGWELAGDSGSAQAIDSGNTATFAGGDVINTVASATDTLTINHAAVSRNDTTSSASPGYGGTVDVVNTVSTSSEGHVTAIDLQTITFPAAENYSWSFEGDTGATQTVASGNNVTLGGGTAISTVSSNTDTLKINLDDTAVTPGSYTLASITVDQQGRITAASSGSSGSMSSWKIGSTTGTDQSVTNGQTVDIVGGTGISGSVGGTRTVTLSLDNTAVTAGSYTSADITVDAQGRITAASNGGAGTMSSWKLAGDSGTQTVTDGDTATFIGGTGITTAASATDDLTITNSLPFNSITLAASTGSNSTITDQDTITIAAGSNISTTNNGSGQVTIAYTGGTGSMSSWTIAGDSGSSAVSNGQTVTIAGSGTGVNAGIDTSESGRTVTVKLDLNEITTNSTIDGDNDSLVFFDSNASGNAKITPDDIHLDQWGDAEADVDFGGNKLLDVATGFNATDGVNLAQVQSIAAGVGLFQGGYNATTGQTVDLSTNGSLDGAANIALDKGDFFAVTVAGTAFFSETLEPGDMIYANDDIAANSNPAVTKYTVVIQDENIAGEGASDAVTKKGVAGFDSGNFGVTANGFVTLDNTGVSAGSYGSANRSLSATVTAKGLLTSLSDQAINITASQVSDFCTAVSTCIAANEQYSDDIGGATSITVNHGLGTRDVMVQLYDNTTFDTVYADVTRNQVGQVTVDFTTAPAADAIRILITKVS